MSKGGPGLRKTESKIWAEKRRRLKHMERKTEQRITERKAHRLRNGGILYILTSENEKNWAGEETEQDTGVNTEEEAVRGRRLRSKQHIYRTDRNMASKQQKKDWEKTEEHYKIQ